MYHFIRTFFIFHLILATIFSLLLCIAPRAHTQYPPGQVPSTEPGPLYPTYSSYGGMFAGGLTSIGLPSFAAYSPIRLTGGSALVGGNSAYMLGGGFQSRANMFQQTGALSTFDQMYAPHMDTPSLSGVAHIQLGRTALSAPVIQDILDRPFVSQSYFKGGTYEAPGPVVFGTVTYDWSEFHPLSTHYDIGNPYSEVIPSMSFAAAGFYVPSPWRYDSSGYGNMSGLGSWGYGYTSNPSYVGYEVPLAYY